MRCLTGSRFVILLGSSLCALPTNIALGQCEPSWSSRFHDNGLNSDALGFATFDEDGSGPLAPRMFAVGSFGKAGGRVVNNIARWDGVSWSGLGGNINGQPGILGTVKSVVTFDPDGDGPANAMLVMCGSFTKTNANLACPGIVAWNGTAFQSLGTLTNSIVSEIAIHDFDGNGPLPPRLVISGVLTLPVIGQKAGIFSYDGTSIQFVTPWLAAQPGSAPAELVSWDEDGAGPGLPKLAAWNSPYLALWDGVAWTTVPAAPLSGFNANIRDLEVIDEDGASGPLGPSLIAGGTFTGIGGISANYIARYRQGAWSTIGSGLDEEVVILGVWDPDGSGPNGPALLAGGYFANAGGVPARRAAQWDGTAWSAVGDGIGGSSLPVESFGSFDVDGAGPAEPELFVGGAFASSQTGGLIPKLTRLRDGVFDNIGEGVISSTELLQGFADSVEGIDGPFLFAAGQISNAGIAQGLNRTAIWDNETWRGLGAGLSNTVANDLYFGEAVLFDADGDSAPNLVVAGEFNRSGTAVVENLVYYDGTSWVDMGAGPMTPDGREIVDMVVFDPDGDGPTAPRIVIGGGFQVVDGLSIPYIAQLGSSGWESLGTGLSDACTAMCVFDADGAGPGLPTLYVVGDFLMAGGITVNKIAKWDGAAWSSIGTGVVSGRVRDLTLHDPDGSGPGLPQLALVGSFTGFNGGTTARVALYDGSTFTAVGAWPNNNGDHIVSLDEDGDGPDAPVLVISSRNGFGTYGGIQYQSLARWNGTVWDNMQGGQTNGGTVQSMTRWDEDGLGSALPALFVGGSFPEMGGAISQSVARWGATAAPSFASAPGTIYFEEGDTIELDVPAQGGQATTITWLKDGNPLADGPRVFGTGTTSVVIDDSVASDEGEYEAVLASGCGEDSAIIQVVFVPPPPTCNGDVNGDGSTDVSDFNILASHFGQTVTPGTNGDLTGDGNVDVSDFNILAGDFGCGS